MKANCDDRSSKGFERRSHRSAFTLVELLVVIAIIGILIGLLLPAIQSAREAGRRLQCSNNLHNLSVALQIYVSEYGRFPPGCVGVTSMEESWGWGAFLLPYIELQGLYDQLGVSMLTSAPGNPQSGPRRLTDVFSYSGGESYLGTAIPTFRCPSDATPPRMPWELRAFKGNGNASKMWRLAVSNYEANQGYFDAPLSGGANDGIFFNDSAVRPADITDGLSHTILLGERDKLCGAGFWAGTRNPAGNCYWGVYENRGRVSIKMNSSKENPVQVPSANGGTMLQNWGYCNSCGEGFSSSHPGGANFAFCDASVHFLRDDIDFNNGGSADPAPANLPKDLSLLGIYQRLGIRDDGQPVTGDF